MKKTVKVKVTVHRFYMEVHRGVSSLGIRFTFIFFGVTDRSSHGALLLLVDHFGAILDTKSTKNRNLPCKIANRERERDKNMVLNLLGYHHRDK